MAEDPVRKAAEMLLSGARMVREPCPYCGGVRVMRGGHAFCSSCGSEPGAGRVAPGEPRGRTREERLEALARRLAAERDEGARRAILAEISEVAAGDGARGG